MTEKREIRKFGGILILISGGLFGVGVWKGSPAAMAVFGVLLAMGFGFAALPSAMKPVYRGWMKVSHFLGRVMTTLLMTFIFYAMISPYALIIRWFRGPLFPLKPSEEADTYWQPKEEGMQPAERFHKRY